VFWQFNRKIVTVFSASDYCRQMGNDGGILILSPNDPPKQLTWRSADVGERKKIFGRDIVAQLMFEPIQFVEQEGSDSDSENSEEEDLQFNFDFGEEKEVYNWELHDSTDETNSESTDSSDTSDNVNDETEEEPDEKEKTTDETENLVSLNSNEIDSSPPSEMTEVQQQTDSTKED